MELILKRFYDNHYSTTGILFADGIPFCVTLEPPYRHKKVMGDTRIPPGRYEVVLVYDNQTAKNYKQRFGIDGVPYIKDVPNFTGILMHIGNFKRDTEGCILVGDRLQINVVNGFDRQKILNSTSTFRKLVDILKEELLTKQAWITILDD